MKHIRFSTLALAAALLLSTACTANAAGEEAVEIRLSEEEITVDGKTASTDPADAVYTGAEIVYYKDGTDASYGEGAEDEKHPAEEAQAHTVVTITQPGTYRLSGTLSKGQIAVDLGKDAKDDPEAVVTLILDNVDVTCTVAPALIFYNVYECDRAWVSYDDGENPDYQAGADVDTSAAGANVVLADGSVNNFTGSHVARIYKEGTTKKLHKYDGAFYSKMSMNITGESEDKEKAGVLNVTSDNEGMDSELHLTFNGGVVNITSQDDGINTNEDFVSVTTVNGGWLTVNAGNGSEGDGIDSNGYLVINGGQVWTMSCSASPDGGVDADSPIIINGGNLYAFGIRNDAADNGASGQPYMELSFASTLPAGSAVELRGTDGAVIWSAVTEKSCQSITLTAPELELDTVYSLYVDGVLQCWNGNSFGMGRPGGFGGGRPEGMGPFGGFDPDNLPENFDPSQLPEGFDPSQNPGNFDPSQLPEGFDPSQQGRPDGHRRPDGEQGGGFGPGMAMGGQSADGSGSTEFVLSADTKSFSGVCDSDQSGKTRVSFTVEGPQRVGRNTLLPAVTSVSSSVEVDPALVQITVTDSPSEDYSASCRLSDGLEAVNALLPEEDGEYLLTVAVAAGSGELTGASQFAFSVGALPFDDVSEQDAGYEAIRAVYKAGAMTGTGDGRFSPSAAVTRAQAVTALARLAGAEMAETDAFSDVAAGSWYSGYVGWAVDSGIVVGDGQGHFSPDAAVTAEEMALMLGRYDKDYVNSTDFSGALTRSQMAQMLVDIM